MRDHDITTPEDYRRKAEDANQIADIGKRSSRLGDLLEWATNDRRERGDESGDYGRIIAMLRARVGRAIEELRAHLQSADNPDRPAIDYEALLHRLEAIRLARTDPNA